MSNLNLTLYECLQQVSLEKYHGRFTERGILDVDGLLLLTMQDYPALGISSMADRQNLFYLIQTIKTMQVSSSQSQRRLLRGGKRIESIVPMEGSAVENRKDLKKGAKRPREVTENSPVAIKFKSKTQDKSPANSPRPSTMSRSTGFANTGGFYNYGVPSIKPKQSLIKRVHSTSELGLSRIQVCVRKRPLSKAEMMGNEEDVVMVTDKKTVELTAPKLAVDLTKYTQKYQFVFDEAFDEHCSNKDVYERTAQPLIKTVFNRGKATCFAYGCTGSGKTFTMLGNEEVQGIYILTASEIFTVLHNGTHGKGLGLWISFYEIYCGQLFDLLNGREKLFAREDANHQVCIAGLTERHVHNVEELMEIIEYGGGVRSTGATGVNSDSSRSHAILQLEVKVIHSGEHVGRFSFIDLAGCERAADVTDTDKQTRVEGAEINQSLLALKECIRALDLDSKHTPFRQSKLTQVLKDSFIGNCQTCMIANISPNKSCSENTLNTLRYADRVKELKKDIPVTPSGPRPLTVPATIPKTDHLFSVDKNNALPRVEIQVNSILGHSQGSPRKLKTGNNGTNKSLRPNTSSTNTALSPRAKDSVTVSSRLVSAPGGILSSNAKKRLTAPVHTHRPQTPPDVATVKTRALASRTQNKPKTSKQKTGNPIKSNGLMTETLEEKCKEMPQTVQTTCEDHESDKCSDNFFASESRLGTNINLLEVVQPGSSTEKPNIEQKNTQKSSWADKQSNESSLPARNSRYGNGIKTRLSKLFSKGNTCMEEPKVIEPQRTRNEHNGVDKPTREMVHVLGLGEQDRSYLSLSQEQLVASHHTELAMVTGLCQEEMVLLKQINSGQKNFKDYIVQLDDILSRKAACIESLREKLLKFPSR